MRRRPAGLEAGSQDGFTLVEIMITSALLAVVLAIILPLLNGSLNIFTSSQVRSDAVDNSQLAFNQIGRDVVSSNILYQDASGIIHLQTFGASGSRTCVEYQVMYPAIPAAQVGMLQRRVKAPGTAVAWPPATDGWTTVMTGIVNSSQAAPAPVVFSIPASSQYQSLVANLWVQLDSRSAAVAAAPENYTSTFTGPAIPANAATSANPSSEPC